MSCAISHPSFSILLFAQLMRRLRHANARYNQIAYQCRRSRRPTHHAKRRAYRVGLCIDTSRARTAWLEDEVHVSASISPLHVSSETWVATEIEAVTATETKTTEDYLPNPWPETDADADAVVRKRPARRLSPLGLGLRGFDDVSTCDKPFLGPVPGAPRWRSKPLPGDDRGHELVSTQASCTYGPVWRGVIGAHMASSVSVPVDVAYGGLGITVPARHLKRKLRDEVVGATVFS